jgi:hypothetical protein
MTPGMIVSALTGLGALIIGLLILHFTPNEEPRSKRSGR